MASVRANALFRELGYSAATFKIDNSTITYDNTMTNGCGLQTYGKAVTLSANATVALVDDGQIVLGRLMRVNIDNFATVQVHGIMILPKGTAGVTFGKKVVGSQLAAVKGYVRDFVNATLADVALARGIALDGSVTAQIGATASIASAAIWID